MCWFNNPALVARLRAPADAAAPVVVDLHGMHVREVRALLTELCVAQTWRGRGRRNRGPRVVHVRIVTGRGLHSASGSSAGGAKLGAAVSRFLAAARKGVAVTGRQSGSVTVSLSSSAP